MAKLMQDWCPTCQTVRDCFKTEYRTMPVTTSGEYRKYEEINCSYCGASIKSDYHDVTKNLDGEK